VRWAVATAHIQPRPSLWMNTVDPVLARTAEDALYSALAFGGIVALAAGGVVAARNAYGVVRKAAYNKEAADIWNAIAAQNAEWVPIQEESPSLALALGGLVSDRRLPNALILDVRKGMLGAIKAAQRLVMRLQNSRDLAVKEGQDTMKNRTSAAMRHLQSAGRQVIDALFGLTLHSMGCDARGEPLDRIHDVGSQRTTTTHSSLLMILIWLMAFPSAKGCPAWDLHPGRVVGLIMDALVG
jgi:hypothetical protein